MPGPDGPFKHLAEIIKFCIANYNIRDFFTLILTNYTFRSTLKCMLIEFTAKNFRSFRDAATLSLEAEPLRDRNELPLVADGTRLLPVAGIFGPNASGKSNIVKALFFAKWAVENGTSLNRPLTSHPHLQPFLLDKTTQKKPSYFQFILWDDENETRYRYGFEATKKEVTAEWLEESRKVKSRFASRMLFTREKQIIKLHKSIQKNAEDLKEKVLPNGLALTVFAQFANEPSLRVYGLIKDRIFIYEAVIDLLQQAFQWCEENPDFKHRVEEFMKGADLGIGGITLSKSPVDPKAMDAIIPPTLRALLGEPQGAFSTQVLTEHKIYGSGRSAESQKMLFNLTEHESLGTQRLFGFAALVLRAVDSGATLIIDEFGNSIHPFISKGIVDIFSNQKINKRKAQLVFCSHETYLLSNKGPGLRRDQIWFTEKDEKERATLHSLAEYKTRKDFEISKNYLEGRFGAVPIVTFKR